MNHFLKQIATEIYEKYGDDISRFCFVFPSRRAQLYFKNYITELLQKPIWSPKLTTINEFIKERSELVIPDLLTLIVHLYQVYIRHKKSNESFDEFYYWGEMMINDFDDIDKYLVNAQDLFKNLENIKAVNEVFDYLTPEQIKAIETFWGNFGKSRMSQHKENFIEIWSVLGDIYADYQTLLQTNGWAYEGMMYRQFAEQVKAKTVDFEYQKIVFIGFNALNTTEKKLFHYIQSQGKAIFYWDYDTSYTDNLIYEAGYFLRENIIEFHQAETKISNCRMANSSDKNITIVSVPSNIGQAKILPQLLYDISKGDTAQYNDTAIVLGDEKLLVPVIYSMPKDIGELNITMGYPFSNTNIFSLFESLIELQRHGIRIVNDASLFYHRQTTTVLQHPVISKIAPSATIVVNRINSKNLIYLSNKHFAEDALLKIIFSPITSGREACDYFLAIITKIVETNNAPSEIFDKEFLQVAYSAIIRLKDVIVEYSVTTDLAVFFRLFLQILKQSTVPFSGEPLAGLQMMGLLETRALDYKNIILLSVNEGVLPKRSASPSFVPYNLRRGFGLPTLEHQDSIFAYYFYRLLHEADNIICTYSNRTDGMDKTEISRLLLQLKYESKFNITEDKIEVKIKPSKIQIIEKQKSESELAELMNYANQQYLSPSAINTYINCPLKFYFKYISKLKEPDTIIAELDAQAIGNVLHKCMQKLYKPFVNQEITAILLRNLKQNPKQISTVLTETISEELGVDTSEISIPNGMLVMLEHIILTYIQQILTTDINNAPFYLLNLEHKFTSRFSFNNGSVNIGGIVDRIDETAENIRIVDYKTGKIDYKIKSLDSLFERDEKIKVDAVFQSLLYSLVYQKNTAKTTPVKPQLLSMRDIYGDKNDIPVVVDNQEISDIRLIADDFEEKISAVLNELFNLNLPFSQTSKEDNCKFCPYKIICHK